jgi:primase-polymerase (primpol)-like protein
MTAPLIIPPELTTLRQFCLWRYEVRNGKQTKCPFSAMGYKASTTDPETWSRFDYLVDLLRQRPDFADGIGFVFTQEDPYTGIDLDDIWQSDADEGAPWAQGLLDRFADTYGEASPSDCGYKIWCRAKSRRCGKWAIGGGAIEIYDRSRYFTLTGRSNGVMKIADHQSDIDVLIDNLERSQARQQQEPGTHASAAPVDAKIQKGQRHTSLVSLAGSMFRRGMVDEAIEAALLVVNEKQCDPPYDEEHITQIVKSTKRWER